MKWGPFLHDRSGSDMSGRKRRNYSDVIGENSLEMVYIEYIRELAGRTVSKQM